MRNLKRQILVFVLLSLVPAFMFAGGGGQSGAAAPAAAKVNPKGVFPIVNEPLTLSMFFVATPQVGDYVNNEATKYIEEKTGIKIDWVLSPQDANAVNERKQILLASGDYPDIFNTNRLFGFTNEDIMKFGSRQGVFIPLNDLINTYGDAIAGIYQKYPTLKNRFTTPDGKIYSIPMTDIAYHTVFYQKCWVNTAWLNKLGLNVPGTTEEFANMLRAFKTRDPNGNGRADELGMTGSINPDRFGEPHFYLMNSFIYTDKQHFFVVNNTDKLEYAPVKDEWREGLRYMASLYKEGLIDSGAFTQTVEQLKTVGTNPGTVIAGVINTGHIQNALNISEKPEDIRHRDYVAIPPLKGPRGTQWAPAYNVTQPSGFVITDRCENPEAAFRFIDFLSQEDTVLVTSEGLEGRTWQKAAANEKNILGEPSKTTRIGYLLIGGQAHNLCWGNNGSMNRGLETDGGIRSWWTYAQDPLTLDGYEVRLYRATHENYAPYENKNRYLPAFLNVDQIDEASQLKVNIEQHVNTSIVSFISGTLDVERDWDNYVRQFEGLGLPRYLEIYNNAWAQRAK